MNIDTFWNMRYAGDMKAETAVRHITDDLGNDVLTPAGLDEEFEALSAVADAADAEHRTHCLLLTANCPICRALAVLDMVRQRRWQTSHN
jgi:hypothetical protein